MTSNGHAVICYLDITVAHAKTSKAHDSFEFLYNLLTELGLLRRNLITKYQINLDTNFMVRVLDNKILLG